MENNETAITEYTTADIKKYICPTATEEEFFYFCQVVKARGLNPFLKEVHFVKYGKAPGQIIVGKDAVLKRARNVAGYRGFKSGWFSEEGERVDIPLGQIMGAWCEVYSTDNEPLFSAVLFNEYTTGQSTWKTKPATMIRKVAIVQAHREFAPEETGGLYDEAEMGSVQPAAANDTDTGKSLEEKLKPGNQKAEPDPVEVGEFASKLAEIVDEPEYRQSIQAILKDEKIMPVSLRTDDEKTAEKVYNLIIEQKGFEEAEIREQIEAAEQTEPDYSEHF